MEIKRNDTEFGPSYILDEGNKCLRITFGGNGDLYWSLHTSFDEINKTFEITKEDYEIYELFDKLYNDIENINISYLKDMPYEEKKKKYIVYNQSNYNELFNEYTKTITWYSDETAHSVANFLRIKKEEDKYTLEFYTQLYRNGYDEDFNTPRYIPIRFRNSGSRYFPFNIVFMNMYLKMSEIDNNNHQIHIEEYLYSKKKVLKNKK